MGFPVLVKAPDFEMNSARAAMPFLVPRISDSVMYLDACLSASVSRSSLYLGHSLRMWFLDSMVALLHGQVVGSGDRGRKC